MIKLKNILLESMSKKEIIDIVNRVYPHIVKDLGGRKLSVEVHNNIWNRVGAVGAEELMEDDNPAAEYDWDKKKIYVYYSGAKNVEEIIRSLLHEHTHSLQNRKKFDDGYKKGYNYKTHPYEKAATKAESKWKKYLKSLQDIKEAITLPIEIGDTILTGKFKNKKIVVKDIGKNEKGDITINGKSILRIRILPKVE